MCPHASEGDETLLTGRDCRKAYVSFGGLLMALEGPDSKLTPLRVDNVYLLIRK